MLWYIQQQGAALNYTTRWKYDRENKWHKQSDDLQLAGIYTEWEIKISKVISACANLLHPVQAACLYLHLSPVPLCLFAYSLLFFAASLSFHPSCGRLFEVSEPSVLVISGCHPSKGLHAISPTNQQKKSAPAYHDNKKGYVTHWCCRCCFWQWSQTEGKRLRANLLSPLWAARPTLF